MLYLASRSPRRRQLLDKIGIEYRTIAVDIEEIWDGRESAEEYVSRLAVEKARAAREKAGRVGPILAADTEVVRDGVVLGKPENAEMAKTMLLSLSGRIHEVYTAVALLHEREQVAISCNLVGFKKITEQQCREYCDSGEPFDKAGAYAIQGRAAAFVCSLDGSFSSVMGLPLEETGKLLNAIQ